MAVLVVASALGPVAQQSHAAGFRAVPVRTVPDPWFSGHAELYAWGATTLPDGTVLIGDYRNYRAVRYATDGTNLGTLIDNNGTAPHGLGTDPRTGEIYLADTERGKIRKFDSTGKFLFEWGSLGSGTGRFKYPSRVAVASDGRVYVADSWSHEIVVHDDQGVELFSFGSLGTGDGQLRYPHGIAFDDQDRLFVADNLNHRVQVFDQTGDFLYKFGSQGSGAGQFQGDLRGLAVDQRNGWVYVVDAEGNRINKYTLQGSFLLSWGTSGTGPGQFIDGGREITVDGDGNVWVAEMPNFRAQKFSPQGDVLLEVPSPASPPPDGAFNGPRGVAVDATGNIFVTDTYNQRFQKFAPDGSWMLSRGVRGRGDYSFNYPRMLATDPRNGSVVIADTDNHVIKKYANDGTFMWSSGGAGKTLGKFSGPQGIDVAADGTIFVADTNNDRVVILDENGTALSAFGRSGTGAGDLGMPRGITADPNGTVWVSDAGNDVVRHFSADGTYLGDIAGPGLADDRLVSPFDIEVDAELVYVADTLAHKIKVWSKDGTFVGSFGGYGEALGRMIWPQGLDLTSEGRLYVAELGGERVQEWSISQVSPPSEVPGHVATMGGPGHAGVYPSGLEVAPDGTVAVADAGNNVVKKYSATGALLWSVGKFGGGTGAFDGPTDVGVDPLGNIYVADLGNRRIVKLSASGSWLGSWRGTTSDPLASPMGIAAAGDLVYVADAGKKKVRVFDTGGTVVRSFGEAVGCSFSQIRDVDADSAGNVYIANFTFNNVLKMSAVGSCLASWGGAGTSNGRFRSPEGVSVGVDAVGNEAVFVADSRNARVQEFTLQGDYVTKFGAGGTGAGRFVGLRKVAVAPGGDVLAADPWGWKVERFTYANGAYSSSQTIGGSPPPLTADQTFNQVRAVAFDAGGNLAAVDTVNARVVRLTHQGDVIRACGQPGWGTGRLTSPTGVAVDHPTSDLWITEPQMNRIQLIAADCTNLGFLGAPTYQFRGPSAIAIRQQDGTAWVADSKNHRIVSIDAETRSVIATFGTRGSTWGRFNEPSGIAVNPSNGRILVADTHNHRIVELKDVDGSSIVVSRVITGGLNRPQGVAADAAGRIYVTEPAADRVRVFSPQGEPIGTLAAPGGFQNPAAVAVNSFGRLFVSDTYHDDIDVYAYP